MALSSQIQNLSSNIISQNSNSAIQSQNSGTAIEEDTNTKISNKNMTPRMAGALQRKSLENRFQINDIAPSISVFNPTKKNSKIYQNKSILESEVFTRSNSQRIL